jgi:menaquinol-cytochrome c reductase iron-sulfur subunit
MSSEPPPNQADSGPPPESGPPAQSARAGRRSFFKEAAAVVIGAVSTLVPLMSGLIVFFDPLRKKAKAGEFVFVASLTALPEDGLPRKFPVIAAHTDAWNKFPPAPVGAVYLRRVGKTVEALNVVCPHAGCFVDFISDTRSFLCPCHNSSFALNGKISDPGSPSPRAMDKLTAQIRNGNEVWVKFQNFQAGEPRQIPA